MSKTGTCSCEHCRALCSSCNPGWFAPGQPTKAATELGMTLVEFFQQYLIFEYWTTWNPGDLYVLAPRRTNQEAGVADWGDNLGNRAPCRLLGPQGCLLSYETRPMECAQAYSCLEEYDATPRLEICLMWQKEPQELLTVSKAVGPSYIQVYSPIEIAKFLKEEREREKRDRKAG